MGWPTAPESRQGRSAIKITKIMKTKKTIATFCAILLIALWIITGMDKLWDLQGFKKILDRQPLPDWAVNYLYWIVPTSEISCLLVLTAGSALTTHDTYKKWFTWGFVFSSVLMAAFTLFIALGVWGWYDKRPCGCGSVISSLSWEEHLVFNVFFLGVALLGVWASWNKNQPPSTPNQGHGENSQADSYNTIFKTHIVMFLYFSDYFLKGKLIRGPRRFALFPGEAGTVSKLCTIAIRRKKS